MAYTNPTVAEFKAYFDRDFPFGTTLDTVRDQDIAKALTQQENTINQCLFSGQNSFTQGALLLSAHYLVMNLRASSQGVAGRPQWLESSKAVGSVSASFQIPDRILENAELSILASTTYGLQYLQMILPYLSGPMVTVAGGTVGPPGGGMFGGPFGAVGPWGGQP